MDITFYKENYALQNDRTTTIFVPINEKNINSLAKHIDKEYRMPPSVTKKEYVAVFFVTYSKISKIIPAVIELGPADFATSPDLRRRFDEGAVSKLYIYNTARARDLWTRIVEEDENNIKRSIAETFKSVIPSKYNPDGPTIFLKAFSAFVLNCLTEKGYTKPLHRPADRP